MLIIEENMHVEGAGLHGRCLDLLLSAQFCCECKIILKKNKVLKKERS